MATDERADEKGIAARMPETYAYYTSDGQPRWQHQQTGLLVCLNRWDSVPERELSAASARTPDDTVWRFEVRPDGEGTFAEIYEPLVGSRSAAVAHVLEWLEAHHGGELD